MLKIILILNILKQIIKKNNNHARGAKKNITLKINHKNQFKKIK